MPLYPLIIEVTMGSKYFGLITSLHNFHPFFTHVAAEQWNLKHAIR
jgi:hypothetical protein